MDGGDVIAHVSSLRPPEIGADTVSGYAALSGTFDRDDALGGDLVPTIQVLSGDTQSFGQFADAPDLPGCFPHDLNHARC